MDSQKSREQTDILMLDSDAQACSAITSLIKPLGYRVLSFHSPEQFIAQLDRLESKVLILDVRIPQVSGLEIQRIFRDKYPATPIIFLSTVSDIKTAVMAMQQGAFTYLLKPHNESELIEAINNAIRLNKARREELVEKVQIEKIFKELSSKEKQVFDRIINGVPSKVIANQMNISVKTVEYYRKNLKKKFNVDSLAKMIEKRLRYEFFLKQTREPEYF